MSTWAPNRLRSPDSTHGFPVTTRGGGDGESNETLAHTARPLSYFNQSPSVTTHRDDERVKTRPRLRPRIVFHAGDAVSLTAAHFLLGEPFVTGGTYRPSAPRRPRTENSAG